MSRSEQIEELLPLVTKPSRYLGNEVNAVHKDLDRVSLKFALAFPDAYEIGMSHTGFQVIYHVLNRLKGVAAERFFCPWMDMEGLMRERGIPLCSQESRTPLHEFDIVGFSIPYEMGYSNILNMLKLGGIPLESDKRLEAFPLVVGGGPCTVNPEPLHAFFDAFVVGDGEDVVQEITEVAIKAKFEGWGKERLLGDLARLPGVYVPRFFQAEYNRDGTLVSVRGMLAGHERVARRIAPSLEDLDYPSRWIVPFTRVVHDRVSLEIARGCTRGCRFCQAGFTYRPVRERSLGRILELAQASLRATGHEELSLLSLSSGDYTHIAHLLRDLMARHGPEKVAISFPSLRVGCLSGEIMATIKEVRKTGITLAPEAGTERLRRVINKDLEEGEILDTARLVFQQGWLSLKLYFMVGLPTETQDDVEGIVGLCRKILREACQRRGKKALHVSLSAFIPKPHTPFQWEVQLPVSEVKARVGWIRRELRRLGVQVRWQDPHLSLLEGVFSRGDRRLSAVLMRAHELGCGFDGWSDRFRFDLWEQAFSDCGIPLEECAKRPWRINDVLPWDHIDVGVSKSYLVDELRRSVSGQRTADCRKGECQGCGVCDQGGVFPVLADAMSSPSPFPGMKAFEGVYHSSRGREIVKKFRVIHTKQGPARFLSHLELNSVIVRALRRGGIPLRFSHGFHPMPRIDFGPALPVGVESIAESFDLESFGHIDAEQILRCLDRELPEGIRPLRCDEIPPQAPSLFRERAVVSYRIQIPEEMGMSQGALEERIGAFRRGERCQLSRARKDGIEEMDVRPYVKALETESPGIVLLQVLTNPEGGVRILELLRIILTLDDEGVRRVRVLKTKVEILGRQ
ncbi:MAG: TIGR03960 family B12-binding radical SAM protein [Thermodesulfobacteriota bacterium]